MSDQPISRYQLGEDMVMAIDELTDNTDPKKTAELTDNFWSVMSDFIPEFLVGGEDFSYDLRNDQLHVHIEAHKKKV